MYFLPKLPHLSDGHFGKKKLQYCQLKMIQTCELLKYSEAINYFAFMNSLGSLASLHLECKLPISTELIFQNNFVLLMLVSLALKIEDISWFFNKQINVARFARIRI